MENRNPGGYSRYINAGLSKAQREPLKEVIRAEYSSSVSHQSTDDRVNIPNGLREAIQHRTNLRRASYKARAQRLPQVPAPAGDIGTIGIWARFRH